MRTPSRAFARTLRLAVTSALAVVLAACGDDGGGSDDDPFDTSAPGTSCGDGVCNGTESASSCAADCGCTSSLSCGVEEVCSSSGCVSAWGRSYRFTVVSASLPTTHPQTGDAWDAFGGAPDPVVVLVADGVEIGRTSTVQDSFTANWNERIDLVFQGAALPQRLEFQVYDEDASVDDHVITIYDSASGWLQLARDGSTSVNELAGTTLTLRAEPL